MTDALQSSYMWTEWKSRDTKSLPQVVKDLQQACVISICKREGH